MLDRSTALTLPQLVTSFRLARSKRMQMRSVGSSCERRGISMTQEMTGAWRADRGTLLARLTSQPSHAEKLPEEAVPPFAAQLHFADESRFFSSPFHFPTNGLGSLATALSLAFRGCTERLVESAHVSSHSICLKHCVQRR